jgi:hypothetical protein
MMSLCPGYVMIFPTFDACWPALACALIVFWRRALLRDDWRYAVAFGGTLAFACFVTYNLLVLGAFLGAWTLLVTPPSTRRRSWAASIATLTAIALATIVLLYVFFWLLTGFNPLATFISAWRAQHALLERYSHTRPYPWTILFDLLDFALGAGWLVVPMAIAGWARWSKRADSPELRLSLALCLAQPALVAVLGLLQSETARVWNFMLPLLLLPAALELSRWPPRARGVAYACMLAITLVVGRHMRFMGP